MMKGVSFEGEWFRALGMAVDFLGFFSWGFIFQGGSLAGNWEGKWVADKWRQKVGVFGEWGSATSGSVRGGARCFLRGVLS